MGTVSIDRKMANDMIIALEDAIVSLKAAINHGTVSDDIAAGVERAIADPEQTSMWQDPGPPPIARPPMPDTIIRER